MSHANIDPAYAAAHYGVHREANKPKERQGTFTHSSYAGSYDVACFIISETDEEYFVRYFDMYAQDFEHAFLKKSDVTLDVEVDEKAYYVIKHKSNGSYHSSSKASSTCPQIYSSKAKAEARLRQKTKPEEWNVKKWDITESDA